MLQTSLILQLTSITNQVGQVSSYWLANCECDETVLGVLIT